MSGASTSSNELAFNARWLSTSQIAASFVPPSIFERLTGTCHSMLVGPRGSGKTTLLKMLQPSTLGHWRAEGSATIKDRIDYAGVFIPADICWREQLGSLSRDAREGESGPTSRLAVVTSILHALVDAAYWRISQPEGAGRYRGAALSREREADLVRMMAKQWELPIEVPSLLTLKHALAARFGSIPALAKEAGRRSQLQSSLDSVMAAPLLSHVSHFVEVFNDYAGESEGKWALLFDELEIAPDWLQDELIRSTRSIDQRLLLKLSLSPYNRFMGLQNTGHSPDSINDFDQIQLWYANRDHYGIRLEQKQFCESMWKAALNARGIPYTSPYKALGESYSFDADPTTGASTSDDQPPGGKEKGKTTKTAYSPLGKRGKVFLDLYQRDRSFKEYIDNLGIDLLNIPGMSEQARASSIRKVAQVVATRDFYRRADLDAENEPGRRGRKSFDLYVGAESLFAVSEGHPRWLKILFARILEGEPPRELMRVTTPKQNAALTASAHRFSALLKTYPVQYVRGAGGGSILKLVQRIGQYFHDEVVAADFKPEPVSSFIVDSSISDDYLEALQTALNLGAIVYVPDGESEIALSSLRGKRFRLSYWLAPVFGIPLVLGKAVALSTVLTKGKQGSDGSNLSLPLE